MERVHCLRHNLNFEYKYLWSKRNDEVQSEYTPVELKQHKKQENDQWRLLACGVFCDAWKSCFNLKCEKTCLISKRGKKTEHCESWEYFLWNKKQNIHITLNTQCTTLCACTRETIKKVLFWVGGVWLYSIILVLYSIVLHLTLVRNVTYFPILIWQKLTKYWTKVVIHGNLVPTKVSLLLQYGILEKLVTNTNFLGKSHCRPQV